MKQKKEIRVTIRLSPEQYESIAAKAEKAGLPVSAFVRASALRHKVTVIEGLKEMTHELKGIGRNLNLLTILANEGKINKLYIPDMVEALNKIYDKLYLLTLMEKN